MRTTIKTLIIIFISFNNLFSQHIESKYIIWDVAVNRYGMSYGDFYQIKIDDKTKKTVSTNGYLSLMKDSSIVDSVVYNYLFDVNISGDYCGVYFDKIENRFKNISKIEKNKDKDNYKSYNIYFNFMETKEYKYMASFGKQNDQLTYVQELFRHDLNLNQSFSLQPRDIFTSENKKYGIIRLKGNINENLAIENGNVILVTPKEYKNHYYYTEDYGKTWNKVNSNVLNEMGSIDYYFYDEITETHYFTTSYSVYSSNDNFKTFKKIKYLPNLNYKTISFTYNPELKKYVNKELMYPFVIVKIK